LAEEVSRRVALCVFFRSSQHHEFAAMSSLVFALGLLACSCWRVEPFCPAGFSGDNAQHREWKIPTWPQQMTELEAGRLRTIKLDGFEKTELNEEYLEGPTTEFFMQGKETYWSAGGEFFVFWCARFAKWRVAAISAFGDNMEDNCYSFVSDGYPNRDVKNASLIKGWIEVIDSQWKHLPDAGVVRVGRLSEQLLAAASHPEEECAGEEGAEEGQAAGDGPFGEKKEKKRVSKCPVTRAVNGVKDGLAAIGKWVRRLFPKLLGAPEPEEGEAREEAVEADSTKEQATIPVVEQVGVPEASFKVRFEVANLEGEKGKIGHFVALVHPAWAPRGAARFRELVEDGQAWDKTRFHRVVKDVLVQFGSPGKRSTAEQWSNNTIKDDPMLADPIKGDIGNKKGYISFAMSGKDARTTQLFINLQDNRMIDKQGFAPVAEVIEGWEECVLKLYAGDAEKPDPQRLQIEGNLYLKKEFPRLSYVKSVELVEGGSAAAAAAAAAASTTSEE